MRARRAAAVMAAALVAWVPPAVSVAATEAPARPLRLCVDPDWAPYEWLDEDGRHRGIAADLLRLIAKGAGVALQLVPTATWDESVSFARSGKCDALSFLNETPERRTWLSFTKPYFFDRNVIITRAEHPDIGDLAAMPRHTSVALPTATSVIERIGHDFPHLRIVPVASEADAFGMVEGREVDMTVRALTIAAYTIKTEGWFNLKIAGELPDYANRMRIGVVGRQPELVHRLDEAIDALTSEQVDEIVNRHVAIDVSTQTDFHLAAQIAVGFAALLLLAYLWIRHLGRLNRRLLELSTQLSHDIEARERAEQALKQSEEHYRLLVEMAQEGILVVQEQRVAYCNPAFAELVGYSPAELAQMDAFSDLIQADDLQRAQSNYARRIRGEDAEQRYPLRLMHKSGRLLWAETSGVPIVWNHAPATLNVINDITARKLAEERIQHMAEHDALTGLPNRSLLLDRLERALAAAQREARLVALLFIDLDGFKPVNDEYGHEVGDALLKAVAVRLGETLRHADTAARIGGDEFVALLPAITAAADALHIAGKLRAALSAPFDIGGRRIGISASFGVALYPQDGDTPAELMRKADAAMYVDKHARQAAGGAQ
jgi:diguanylate cyclase (GGDEF)-like protein/PAS domain S-box-containing protein